MKKMAEKKKGVTIKDISVVRKDYHMVKPESIIVPENWNERARTPELEEHIEGLAVSIATEGVKLPLTLRKMEDGFHLTDGFCRMEAVKLARSRGTEVALVPIILEEKHSNEVDHVASMLIRNEGLKLSTTEQARVAKRLFNLGETAKSVQARTGKSHTHINNLVLLNSAHPDLIGLIEEKKVATELALDLLRKNPDKALDKAKGLIKKAAQKGKAKATKGNSTTVPGKRWAKYGPMVLKSLTEICDKYDEIDTVPDELADLIETAKELVGPLRD
jgi:ParB/RepB/Spo0J family partition protein